MRVKEYEDHRLLLEELIVKQADDKEELEAHRDKHELAKDELQSEINHLRFQLEQTDQKLQVQQSTLHLFKLPGKCLVSLIYFLRLL